MLLRLRKTMTRLGVLIASGLMVLLTSAGAHAQTAGASAMAPRVMPVSSMAADWWACVEAAQHVEAIANTPEHLLTAISLTETGTRTPNRSVAPWPWTINVGGRGYFYATKAQAIEAARNLINEGRRSFDVGCMQVNMRYHPRAFTSFEEAFDPISNVTYAADFISRLRSGAGNGSWTRSVELYHSYNEEFNQIYGERVRGFWGQAQRRADSGDVLMATRQETSFDDPSYMTVLPEGFGPRPNLNEDSLRQRASMNGFRLARAVDEARAAQEESLENIAPMAVAVMRGSEAPLVLSTWTEPALTGPRAQAIRRRLQPETTDTTAFSQPAL